MKNSLYVIALLLMLTLLSNTTMNEDNKDLYTLGVWTVKPGKEQTFIDEWTSFSKWTDKNATGGGKGYLLQDQKNPLRFISFGSWDTEKSIQDWRSSDEFKAFATKARELCDDFQPNTLKVVATSK